MATPEQNELFKLGEDMAEMIEIHLITKDVTDEAFQEVLSCWVKATEDLRKSIYRSEK